MRELKFRFWNKIARTYKRSWRNAICNDGKFITWEPECTSYSDPIEFSRSIIVAQQYTGLKDKNDKEIYEGDIIQLEGSPISYSIEWDKYQWAINAHGALGYDPDWNIQPFNHCVYERAIVVGNIFENSDLLKQ